MEKIIVEQIGFIKEENYQEIKKFLNKKDDLFNEHEFYNFNAVLMQRH
jgi:hypothetical protein